MVSDSAERVRLEEEVILLLVTAFGAELRGEGTVDGPFLSRECFIGQIDLILEFNFCESLELQGISLSVSLKELYDFDKFC